MTENNYKILHFEENNNKKLISHRFLAEKIKVDFTVVNEQENFARELNKVYNFNLILIEDFLEHFTAIDALDLVSKICQATPVVVLANVANKERILRTLEAGAIDYIVRDEIIKLPTLIDRLIKLKFDEKQLEKLALYEPITGLPNRRLLNDTIERAIERAIRNKSKFMVMCFGLNHFEKINEALNPKSIESLLIEAANRLCAGVRKSDFIAYLGEDKFVGVFENAQTNITAVVVAKQIIKDFYRPFVLEGERCNCTLSIGIAKYPDMGSSTAYLLLRSEQALRKAQENGHNNFEFFVEGMDSDVKRMFALENQLYKAVKNNEIYLAYQPLYRLNNDKFCGFEVLSRWNNQQFGNILPQEFIPIAENTGLINELGNWIVNSAFMQYKAWTKQYATIFSSEVVVSINLSPVQLLSTDIVEMISNAIRKYEINPCSVVLEMAENAIIKPTDRVRTNLNKLNALGIRIAIDDFGVGNSSLNYLRNLPVKILKIDAGFISNLFVDENGEKLIKGIIMLGKAMNLEVVAEGVENSKQKEFLAAQLCDIGQGYYFSRPMDNTELEKLLIKSLEENKK